MRADPIQQHVIRVPEASANRPDPLELSTAMGKPQRRKKVHFGDTHLARRWRTRSRKRDLDQVRLPSVGTAAPNLNVHVLGIAERGPHSFSRI